MAAVTTAVAAVGSAVVAGYGAYKSTQAANDASNQARVQNNEIDDFNAKMRTDIDNRAASIQDRISAFGEDDSYYNKQREFEKGIIEQQQEFLDESFTLKTQDIDRMRTDVQSIMGENVQELQASSAERIAETQAATGERVDELGASSAERIAEATAVAGERAETTQMQADVQREGLATTFMNQAYDMAYGQQAAQAQSGLGGGGARAQSAQRRMMQAARTSAQQVTAQEDLSLAQIQAQTDRAIARDEATTARAIEREEAGASRAIERDEAATARAVGREETSATRQLGGLDQQMSEYDLSNRQQAAALAETAQRTELSIDQQEKSAIAALDAEAEALET